MEARLWKSPAAIARLDAMVDDAEAAYDCAMRNPVVSDRTQRVGLRAVLAVALERAASLCEAEATAQEAMYQECERTDAQRDRIAARCRTALRLRDDIRSLL